MGVSQTDPAIQYSRNILLGAGRSAWGNVACWVPQILASLSKWLRSCDMRPNQHGLAVPGGEDVEVCSETLQIESKIFFCDAKTNTRGLYLKVSEKKANRERSTIIVPGQSLPWFRELFNYYATTEAALATSKEYPVESKVFFWSHGCNPWGRYLRISENGAGPKGRSHIMVPCGGANAEGWLAFRDALSRIEAYTSQAAPTQIDVEQLLTANLCSPLDDADLLSSYLSQGLERLSVGGSVGTSDKALQQPPPPPPHVGHETVVGPGPTPPTLTMTEEGSLLVRAGHKRYFFDACSNHHGEFLRVTEVFGQDRIAIVVPSNAIGLFHQALGMCISDVLAGNLPSSLPLVPGGQTSTGGPSSLPFLHSLCGGVPSSMPVGGPSLPGGGPGLYRGASGSLPGGGYGLPGVGPSSLPFLASQQREWQQHLHSSASSLDLHTSGLHAPSHLQSSQPQWDPRQM
ncbi:g5179 [Coccomyxa elongata]